MVLMGVGGPLLEMLSLVWAKFSKGNEKKTPKIKKVKIRKIGLRAQNLGRLRIWNRNLKLVRSVGNVQSTFGALLGDTGTAP